MKFLCPICHKGVRSTHFACSMGAKGGRKTGPTKARTSEQARKAAMARWKKVEAT